MNFFGFRQLSILNQQSFDRIVDFSLGFSDDFDSVHVRVNLMIKIDILDFKITSMRSVSYSVFRNNRQSYC